MSHQKPVAKKTLAELYPPSPPCSCDICLSYCTRPGWWTVEEAASAMEAGYARRMMLEIWPSQLLGVLSPAFKGCEAWFSLQSYAKRGCTFLKDGRCELYATGFQPLECRYCHHTRPGKGRQCHLALEADWRTPAGRALVRRWSEQVELWARAGQFRSAGF